MKHILVTTFFVLVFAVSVNAGQIGGGQIGLDANASLTLSTVTAIHEGMASEKFRVRFSADSGATWFDDVSIEGQLNVRKREASAAPTETDFIFNRNTQIVAESKSESGGNSVVVWLEIQEL